MIYSPENAKSDADQYIDVCSNEEQLVLHRLATIEVRQYKVDAGKTVRRAGEHAVPEAAVEERRLGSLTEIFQETCRPAWQRNICLLYNGFPTGTRQCCNIQMSDGTEVDIVNC